MSATARPRWTFPALLGLALLGALIGFLAARQAPTHLLNHDISGPEETLVALARAAAGGPDTGRAPAISAPLYVRWLAAAGGAGVTDPMVVRRIQWIGLGFLLPLLAGLAAWRAFGRGRVPLMAAGLTLLPGAVWLQAGALVPAGLQAVCGVLALIAALHWPRGQAMGVVRALLLGLLLVLARLAGAAWAPFVGLLFLGLFLWRRRWLAALTLALAALLILPGADLLNRGIAAPAAGPPLFLGGLDAALGFHDGASGIETRRGDLSAWRWLSARDLALEADRGRGRRATAREVSRFWYRRAAGWALQHPFAAIPMVVKRSFLTLSGYDPPSPDSFPFRAAQLLPWARPLLPLAALVTGCGLVGLVLAGRRRPSLSPAPPAPAALDAAADGYVPPADVAPFVVFLIGTLLATGLYIVRAGDRLPLLLILTAPAAVALDSVLAGPTSRRLRLLPVLLGLALLLSLPWLTVARRAESAAEDRFLLASALAHAGQGAPVTEQLEAALRIDPGHAAARLALSAALAQDGLFEEAASEARRVTVEQPGLAAAWRLSASLEERNGRYEDSANAYLKLIALDPLSAEARNNLGTIYVTLVRYDDAVAAFRKALEVDPNYTTARKNLDEVVRRGPEGIKGGRPSSGAPQDGMTQLRQGVGAMMQALQAGDVPRAEGILAGLRDQYGSTPDIDFGAATLHLQKGEMKEAIELYERCREAMPGNPYLLNNLATAYARSGNVARALPLWEQVLQLDPKNETVRKNVEAARAAAAGTVPQAP